jgi:hypothetical protein
VARAAVGQPGRGPGGVLSAHEAALPQSPRMLGRHHRRCKQHGARSY